MDSLEDLKEQFRRLMAIDDKDTFEDLAERYQRLWDSWLMIELLLAQSGEPSEEQLAVASKHDPVLRPRVQAYLAKRFSGQKRSAGRREVPRGEFPDLYLEERELQAEIEELYLINLVLTAVPDFADEKDPEQAALEHCSKELRKEGRNVSPASLRRYFMKACARHPKEVERFREKN